MDSMLIIILLLAVVYLVGFGISLGYILKPDLKRTLITNGIVVGATIIIVPALASLANAYDGMLAFLAASAGLVPYLFFVSFAALVAGIVHRSAAWAGAGGTGLLICLLVFMILRNAWDESLMF